MTIFWNYQIFFNTIRLGYHQHLELLDFSGSKILIKISAQKKWYKNFSGLYNMIENANSLEQPAYKVSVCYFFETLENKRIHNNISED